MGKSLESVARLKELSRVVSSAKSQRPKGTQPRSPNRVATPRTARQGSVKAEPAKKKMEAFLEGEQCRRTPLARVVADCAKRWFQDTLKEAKDGDSAMQVLVGQMYYSGYGVRKDPLKVFYFFHLMFLYMFFNIIINSTTHVKESRFCLYQEVLTYR